MNVNVCGRIYKINVKDMNKGQNKNYMTQGSCDKHKKIITLDSTLDERDRQETLLHEIFHALLGNGIGANFLSEKQEEGIVTCLASGLTQVFSDNPDLFATKDNKK